MRAYLCFTESKWVQSDTLIECSGFSREQSPAFQAHECPVKTMAFTGDGIFMLSGDEQVRIAASSAFCLTTAEHANQGWA